MIALRPYHISVDYCAMMIEAFNEIQPNRLVLNFLSGQDTPDQNDHNNYLNDHSLLEDKQERREFIRNYLSGLVSRPLISTLPKFVISGHSEYAIDTAELFNSTILSMLAEYLTFKNRYTNASKKMVAVNLFIRDTEKQAKSELESMIDS
jgi:alkanesulfonate monooxygenase SsuD/methylene tetrahydromethanopterin reductase-like flavin-dependent oxidoreductase (luciferase family)